MGRLLGLKGVDVDFDSEGLARSFKKTANKTPPIDVN